MRKNQDLNKYNTPIVPAPSQRVEGEFSQTAGATVRTMGGMVWKTIKTIFWVAFITGLLVFLSVASFILSFKDVEPPNISAMALKYSSHIYLQNDDGTEYEYQELHRDENRVWMPLKDIPPIMQTAQICIEDHRFYEHKGVDWRGTLGAVAGLMGVGGGAGRGGSTLTQQLIKNITGEKQVSILRKVKEIFTALNMEDDLYTKEEILEAYLNLVNYGGTNQGVEAAALSYFGKTIGDCSLAECALIAGITQYPWQYNPQIFPEDSKKRCVDVLDRMLELSQKGEITDPRLVKITQAEYDQAIAELETMTFDGGQQEDTSEEHEASQDQMKWNWYIDVMFEDVVADLMAKYGYSRENAVSMMYNSGLEIHCAMDLKLQQDMEHLFLTNTDMLPDDPAVQLGFFMMDPYTGKVMAVIGAREARNGLLLFNNATQSARQSGSAIKAVWPYAMGIESGAITYGSVLKDQPIPEFSSGNRGWPQNFSETYQKYMCVDRAIAMSQNAPAAWLAYDITPQAGYEWLVDKLHFSTLVEEDRNSVACAIGGQTYGVTVRDMTAAFCMFANGGVYRKPMTYYYVKDHDGNVILDNRDNPGEQVMTPENATVMNKLLHEPIYNASIGTAYDYLSGLPTDIFGKTGTTDSFKDLYFVGGTPFCVAGVWNGYEYSVQLEDDTTTKVLWRAVIQHLLDNYDWSGKQYVLSENVVQRTFCRSSGLIAGGSCYDTALGYYSPDNIPRTCNGGSDHIAGKAASPSPSASPSAGPSASPSASPSTSPSADPSVSPSPGESSGGESSSGLEPPFSSDTEPPVSSDPFVSFPSEPPIPSEPPSPPEPPPVTSIPDFEPNVPAA